MDGNVTQYVVSKNDSRGHLQICLEGFLNMLAKFPGLSSRTFTTCSMCLPFKVRGLGSGP